MGPCCVAPYQSLIEFKVCQTGPHHKCDGADPQGVEVQRTTEVWKWELDFKEADAREDDQRPKC